MSYYTTLNVIRAVNPCVDGWGKLLAYLGKTRADDEPLDLLTVLESNGLEETLWCVQALGPEHHAAVRLLVCDLVEPALAFTKEPSAHAAVETARRYARGQATEVELWDAHISASYNAADAAADVAGAAVYPDVSAAVSHVSYAAAEFTTIAEQQRILRAWLEAGPQG